MHNFKEGSSGWLAGRQNQVGSGRGLLSSEAIMACDDASKKASFRRQMAADQIIVTFKLKAKVNLHTTNFEWDWSKSTSPQKICRYHIE